MSLVQKWFMHTPQIIKGPLTVEEVIQFVKSSQNELNQTHLWTRGMNEWVRADKWNPQVTLNSESQLDVNEKIISDKHVPATSYSQKPTQKPIFSDNDAEITQTGLIQPSIEKRPNISANAIIDNIQKSTIEKFKLKYHEQPLPDMTIEEVLHFVIQKTDPDKILVYDKKKTEWRDIYTIPEVSNKLGISRRKSPRVPILAQYTGTSAGRQIEARVVTIGAGGFGLTDHFILKLGDITSGQISSPHFYSAIPVKAEVTYGGLDGYIGLKFIEINDEGSALIGDYIKRFETNLPKT